jgi:hypothetical protein
MLGSWNIKLIKTNTIYFGSGVRMGGEEYL